MLQEKKPVTWARKIRDWYCYFDFYLNRGFGMVNGFMQLFKFTAYGGIIVLVMDKFGWNLPADKIIVFTPLIGVALIFLGMLDVKKIKMLQKINEISTRYNPVFSRMDRQIKQLYGKQVGNILKK